MNTGLAAVAALLHDVDKLPAAGAPQDLRHGEGSAAWLEARGWPGLAEAVRHHPVTRLAESGHPAWLDGASNEARIVAYADKRAGQHLEPMSDRFASWRRRYPPTPVGHRGPTGAGWDVETAALVEERALALEREVCHLAGVAAHEVRRLRWSRRALREAVA